MCIRDSTQPSCYNKDSASYSKDSASCTTHSALHSSTTAGHCEAYYTGWSCSSQQTDSNTGANCATVNKSSSDRDNIDSGTSTPACSICCTVTTLIKQTATSAAVCDTNSASALYKDCS